MKKNILILVIVVLLVMAAFWYLNGGSTNASSDSSLTTTQSSSESSDAQYIYSLLQQMKQVQLNDALFFDPLFQNLQDNTVSFSSEPAGRINPFAPVGQSNSAAQSSTTIKVRIK